MRGRGIGVGLSSCFLLAMLASPGKSSECEKISSTVTVCADYPFATIVDSKDGSTLTLECGVGASWNGWSDYLARKLYRRICGSSLGYGS